MEVWDQKRSMKQRKRTSEEMYPLVEAYLGVRGRITIKEFSSSHGISEAVFTYWLIKYRRQMATREEFVEITPPSGGEAAHPLVELLYPNGIRVRLFAPVAPSYLASLLGTDRGVR